MTLIERQYFVPEISVYNRENLHGIQRRPPCIILFIRLRPYYLVIALTHRPQVARPFSAITPPPSPCLSNTHHPFVRRYSDSPGLRVAVTPSDSSQANTHHAGSSHRNPSHRDIHIPYAMSPLADPDWFHSSRRTPESRTTIAL